MAYSAEKSHSNTSIYYSYFQILFETVDNTAYFWQPFMRAVGTSHMEIAGLQARQAQALVRWTHEVMRPAPTPMHHFNCCADLWSAMIGNCADAAPRVAAASSSVAAPVVQLPVKRTRDRLVLLDRDERTGETYERKVA